MKIKINPLQSFFTNHRGILLGTVLFLLLSMGSSQAALETWIQTAIGGTTTAYFWNSSVNWSPNTVPNGITTYTAVFNENIVSNIVAENQNTNANVLGIDVIETSTGTFSLTNNGASNPVHIGAGGITVSGGASGAGTQSFGYLQLAASQTWTLGGYHTTSFSNAITVSAADSGNTLTILLGADSGAFEASGNSSTLDYNIALVENGGSSWQLNNNNALGTGTITLSTLVADTQNRGVKLLLSANGNTDYTQSNNIIVGSGNNEIGNSTGTSAGRTSYLTGNISGSGQLADVSGGSSNPAVLSGVVYAGGFTGFTGTFIHSGGVSSFSNTADGSATATYIVQNGKGYSNSGTFNETAAGQGLMLTATGSGPLVYQFGSLQGTSVGVIGTSVVNDDTTAGAQVQQTGQSYVIQAGALGNANDVFAGTIGDPVGNTYNNTISFVKVGTGGMTLSGANTYTGGTTVSAGTLFVSNSVGTGGSGTGTGAVTVASTGTLRGSGTITPSDGVSGISISGNLHPGDAAVGTTPSGNLTFNLALTSGQAVLQNGATLTFDLGAGGSNPTSALALASDITNELVFNNNTVNLNDLTGGGLNVNTGANQYILIEGSSDTDYSGLTINGVANAQTNGQITAGLILGNNAGYYSSELFLENGDIVVDIVPEPSTWALMLGSLALLVFYQRRRSNRLAISSRR